MILIVQLPSHYLYCTFKFRSFKYNIHMSYHYAYMHMQYTAIFHGCKKNNFQMKNNCIFSYFCSKHRLMVHVRITSLSRF